MLTYVVQIDELWINAGGFSSIHYHRFRHNLFLVESGLLCVEGFNPGAGPNDVDAKPDEIHYLRGGDSMKLEAGIIHRFVAIEDTLCTEVYWGGSPEVDPLDIVRFAENGHRVPRELPETVFRQMFTA